MPRLNAKEVLSLIENIPAPSNYDVQKAKVAAITCTSDTDFADFLDLDVLVFKHWYNKYPSYKRAVDTWRDNATRQIERSLAKRAIGFTKAVNKDVLTKLGTVETLTIETYYPPDPTAAQFWLKNRAGEDWKDKTEVDVNIQANIRAWLVAAGEEVGPTAIEGEFNLVESPLKDNQPLNISAFNNSEIEAPLIIDNTIEAELVATLQAAPEPDSIPVQATVPGPNLSPLNPTDPLAALSARWT
jgi:hypothetical protein